MSPPEIRQKKSTKQAEDSPPPSSACDIRIQKRLAECFAKSFPQKIVFAKPGGPEKVLPNGAEYVREDSCSEDVRNTINDFLRNSYGKHPSEEVEYSFCWHGLMGYTPNGIRRIGPEPCNPVLLYNLGCNGVGILPSIFGGIRISRFLKGEQVEHSIFDPHDQRCEI